MAKLKYPNILFLERLLSIINKVHIVDGRGEHIPTRPLGPRSFGYRVKAAWLVFAGKADALVWPGRQ